MAWAQRQYHDCLLNAPDAEPARKYLQDRGITAESIERFQLGFSPTEPSWILQRAGGTPARARVLETIGVLARPAGGGNLYDRFKGRVLFAIRDVQGRPVGLGGRVLPGLSDSPAKYVNSPETPLFAKSHLLYGLDVARETIRKSRTALVMEGYTDCIIAHQYGFTDAVAVLGTALGEGHVRILKRFADRIVLVLDGDEAGRRRANEVLELFVAQQVDLRILTLPDELDPCEFLLARGGRRLPPLVGDRDGRRFGPCHPQSHPRHRPEARRPRGHARRWRGWWRLWPRRRGCGTTPGARRLREQKILEQLAFGFRVPEAEVRDHLTAVRRKAGMRSAPPAADAAAAPSWRPAEKIDPRERELLELLLGHPECWPAATLRLRAEQFASQACRQVFETCRRLLAEGVAPEFDRLMLEFDDPAIKNLLVELDENEQSKGSRLGDPPALLEELIDKLFQEEAQRQRPAQIVALREGRLDTSQENALLEEILRQEKSRQGISGPTDG